MSKYPTLYHGTSFRTLEMTAEERAQMRKDCNAMIDSLWQYFEPFHSGGKIYDLEPKLTIDNNPRIFINLCNALNIINAEKIGNKLYDLGDFYVTNLDFKAVSYASRSFAFGEIGLRAYRMYEAIRELKFENWSPSDELAKSIERVVAFAEAPERPAVYVFKDISTENLLSEDGEKLSDIELKYEDCFRVTGEIIMDPAKAIPVKQFADSCDKRKWPPCYW
ncbi:hypothetical protein [Prevotella sp. P5-92]|uniref:hypothetical protein n=1 Tax=Prevotella sp. P5-92 TaxID=2024222 RepID=UPI000B9793AE|nr:hypothetical protein [Prevotella sp. P5-92]